MTFAPPFPRPFSAPFDRHAAAAAAVYTDKIVSLFGSALVGYYPLSETSGTTVFDASGNGRNGTLGGAYTLGAAGIGDGGTSILFDTGYGTVYDNARAASPWDIFAEGSLLGWMQIPDLSVWNELWTMRSIGVVMSDWNPNYGHKVGKGIGVDEIKYLLGLPTSISYIVAHPTNWNHVGVTWSQTSNAAYMYWNGVVVGGTVWYNLATVWMQVYISQNFKGRLAHIAFLNRAATASEMLQAATIG